MLLVVVDTTQIQPYIFGSNRLRENVGASYLVDAATRVWALEAVREAVPGETNIGPEYELLDNKRIEQGLAAEVLYAGGGNFVVLFGSNDDQARERAKEFQRALSMRALLEAPGLQLVIAQQALQWGSDSLSSKLNKAFRALAVQKRNRAWSAPLLGLGVTASCNSTGLPATGLVPGIGGEPPYLASDEIQAKVGVAWHNKELSAADERLQKALPLEKGGKEQYLYPRDFDEMGATAGEYSYIAVVHADGNSMRQHILHICEVYESPDKNREFVRELRKFSLDVEKAAKAALNAVLAKLVQRIKEGGGKSIVHKLNQKMLIQIELAKSKDGKYYVPFRPIVFGGDDVTFICDGRLGLSLAIEYLREFERQTALAHLGENNGGLTACAGIAIVKSHYPFARAYALAEELAKSAKDYRRKNPEITGSCLDWHFALSGLSGSIEAVRDREYQVSAGSLTLRPVTLDANPKEAQRAWPVIEKGIDAFQGENWAGHHNKVKALRDVLREGPAAVEHFLEALKLQLPVVLSEMSDWPTKGWQGKYCGYFDAIELADWFIPLKGEGNATAATASQP